MIIHATFKVSGSRDQLAAFDARVQLLFAEHGIAGQPEEQHAADTLHYDLKVEGGIPFPPFALASGEFPDLTVRVEWIDANNGVRGMARIARGTLAEQETENLAAVAADHAVAIRLNAQGYLALALAAIRTGHDECSGYMLSGTQDALFRIARDGATGAVELLATQGAAEWARAWHVSSAGAIKPREIDPPQPIPDADFRELEKLAQEFVAQWVWFSSGPREEIAIEAERYERLGFAISAANLRSAALHRIKSGAGNVEEAVHYSTLDPEIAWVEEMITRCWPGEFGTG